MQRSVNRKVQGSNPGSGANFAYDFDVILVGTSHPMEQSCSSLDVLQVAQAFDVDPDYGPRTTRLLTVSYTHLTLPTIYSV